MAVIFENPGEIDPRMISTFGVNVKENDSAIGFFGTGLKYAIAILLRNHHRISIQLIEEYVHLKHDVRDCSRGMQEHLLNRLVSTGEQLIGEPL